MSDKLLKKAEELMAKVKKYGNFTLWDLLADEPADGFTMQEVYMLYMYLDKVWYDADHYWKGSDGELKLITPKTEK